MQVFTLGGPQGNTGQKCVLVKKPVSRRFIVLSSLKILFFCCQRIAYTFIINNVFFINNFVLYHFIINLFILFLCGIYVWENTPVHMSWLRMY